MKRYLIKMVSLILITCGLLYPYKNQAQVTINTVDNDLIFTSFIPINYYEQEIVYEDLTLKELGAKIDQVFASTLNGYGTYVASASLKAEVDPLVAASIMLVETGCKWRCSTLTKKSNNVGGLKTSKGYAKYNTLEEGIDAFIRNLARNYYQKGLTTPKLMNKKYAANPNWHKDVNYYVELIKAS